MGDARVIRWISTPDEARARSAQIDGVYTCWTCGKPAPDAVVKARSFTKLDRDLFGMYHLACDAKDGK